MAQEAEAAEPQVSGGQVTEKENGSSSGVEKEKVAEEAELPLSAEAAIVEKTQENGGVSARKEVMAPVNVEDMDEEILQEQAQAVVEELQKRGACTTLALSRMLGMERSTDLNPLLYLLLEKNVVIRVTDIPPIWSLSPAFPISPLPSSAAAIPVVQAAPALAPASSAPAPPSAAAYSPSPAYTSVRSFQPARVMPQPAQAVNRHPATIITFPPIPAEQSAKPIITFPPIPAEPQAPSYSSSLPATPGALQQPQQQLNADYWHSLSQISGGKNNRNGGAAPPFKKWKKQKNLSELQMRLLKELKERGPMRTLELSKIVGLVTCRDVNPSIYDLKQRNLVVKVKNAPPVWQLNEPGMNRVQSKLDDDDDEDQFEREMVPEVAFGGDQLTVNSQGHSSLSFFH